MTDAPHTPTLDRQNQPFTVLLMMPDHMREDESCEADWVRRIWVFAPSPEDAGAMAQNDCEEKCGWDEGEGPDNPEDLAIVAIYAGHLLDLHQP